MTDLLSKLTVLKALFEKDKWSLRELSWRTGISEERLMEVINELSGNYVVQRDEGLVAIASSDNPAKIKPWGWNIYHELIVGSTQVYARGLVPWSIVVAEHQLHGYGRHKRMWESNLGGIWATAVISLPADKSPYLNIAIPLTLQRVLRRIGVKAWIKWPNDIVVEERKLGGTLIEGVALQDSMTVYIGVGINVNNDIGIPEATSLKRIVGLTPRNRVLAPFIGYLTRVTKLVSEPSELVDEYLSNLITLNRVIVAETIDGIIEGKAVEVDEYGSLIVSTKNGVEVKLEPWRVIRLRHGD
ncbi:MAG: biotin--[acetyl-CoA-carboxylase] ligase [Desulfurococcaceae archaeon]|nr:biotin--[acetyl-CoA-carboxylase] ligase [Sulfolobales archaeon]MDW8169565.1 biotin--[acetyl-CoA-carboxylase] ligase [Desulfurococcaceae archaeon]